MAVTSINHVIMRHTELLDFFVDPSQIHFFSTQSNHRIINNIPPQTLRSSIICSVPTRLFINGCHPVPRHKWYEGYPKIYVPRWSKWAWTLWLILTVRLNETPPTPALATSQLLLESARQVEMGLAWASSLTNGARSGQLGTSQLTKLISSTLGICFFYGIKWTLVVCYLQKCNTRNCFD